MIELQQVIYNKLKMLHTRIYQEERPQKDPETGKTPEFPYVVYKFSTNIQDGYREDFFLDIDIWDNNSDPTNIDSLADTIDGTGHKHGVEPSGLNRFKYISSSLQVSIYKLNRISVPDPNERIKRRQLRYQVKTYFK